MASELQERVGGTESNRSARVILASFMASESFMTCAFIHVMNQEMYSYKGTSSTKTEWHSCMVRHQFILIPCCRGSLIYGIHIL
ncbi:hypothetical protein BS78_01G158400 [Paspalum vaginatum]|nr:hypothetical protein BS78_01G158400 [Paspalum vaginatum]